MFQQFLAESRHLLWPLLALVLFLVFFVGVLVYIARGILKRKSFDHVAALPLDDDAPEQDGGGLR
jgi:cbb3-type cytochrome oxidase subunit 3